MLIIYKKDYSILFRKIIFNDFDSYLLIKVGNVLEINFYALKEYPECDSGCSNFQKFLGLVAGELRTIKFKNIKQFNWIITEVADISIETQGN